MKKLFALLLIIVISMVLVLIIKNSGSGEGGGDPLAADPRIPATAEGRRQLEESYLSSALDSTLVPYAHLEIPTLENIATGTAAEGSYLDLRIFPDQPLKNNGIRTEVSIDYPYQEGDVVEYSWQFRLPKDFPNDAPENRWWVLADWHDQPDPRLGETWDSYESRSAPIIFGYGYLDNSDVIGLSIGSWKSAEGVEPIGALPIKREVWHTIKMVVNWSQQQSGRVTVYVDGASKPAFDVVGENMVNGYQHYMKVGQYRHPKIQTDNTISIKNVSIQTIRSVNREV